MCISGRRSQSLYLDKERVARGTDSRKNVRSTDRTNPGRRIFLYRLSCCFSGNLAGKNLHPYFVPPVYDLLQPQGFFKIEEEQISAINVRISALEVNPHYLHLKEKLDRETEQTRLALIQAKEELKTAKKERELRRKSSPALSKEEQDALVRESQYQKAEFKRLERGWKERIKTLEEEVITFETEIEKLKTNESNVRQPYSKSYSNSSVC